MAANAVSISTCHSHHEACQLRATVTASIASASSTQAAAIAMSRTERRCWASST